MSYAEKLKQAMAADFEGLAEHRFSPGVREMCCREALPCSFEVASDNLHRAAQSGDQRWQVVSDNRWRIPAPDQVEGWQFAGMIAGIRIPANPVRIRRRKISY